MHDGKTVGLDGQTGALIKRKGERSTHVLLETTSSPETPDDHAGVVTQLRQPRRESS